MRGITGWIGVILGSATLLAFASGCGSYMGAPTSVELDSRDVKVSPHEPNLPMAFRLLRTPGYEVSPDMLQRIGEAGEGGDREQLRAHRTSTRDGPIWLTVDGGSLCLLASRPLAIACAPARVAERRGVVLGIVEHPGAPSGPGSQRRFVLYGVVPNRTNSVEILRGHAEVIVVPVLSNAFSVRSRKPLFLQTRKAATAAAVRRCAGRWSRGRCRRSA
jgi:hypothetical protein